VRLQLVMWTLRRRPWRNALIAGSLAITMTTMIVFFSMVLKIKEFVETASGLPYERLWINERASSNSFQILPLAFNEQLAKIPGVQHVNYGMIVLSPTPDGQLAIGNAASAKTLEYERDFFPVDDATMERWAKERTGAVFADKLAAKLGLEIGEEGELPTPTGPVKFRVSGISPGTVLSTRFVLHYEYVDELMGRPGITNVAYVVVDRAADRKPVFAAVDELLATSGIPSQLVTEGTIMKATGSGQAVAIPALLGALGLLLLITTGAAVANATVISVRERRAELATLRVLGFKKRVLASIIFAESLLVCAIGGVLGVVLAWLAMRNGLPLGTSPLFQAVSLSREGLVAGLIVSLAIPIVGSALSSWLAVRAPLAQALRDAG
jgi:putative ABC transport system permease protein